MSAPSRAVRAVVVALAAAPLVASLGCGGGSSGHHPAADGAIGDGQRADSAGGGGGAGAGVGGGAGGGLGGAGVGGGAGGGGGAMIGDAGGVDASADATTDATTGSAKSLFGLVSGAGAGRSTSYRLRLVAGSPGVSGAGASAAFKLRLGAP